MKIIFMSPKKACLSILYALFTNTRKNEWIGPRVFDVWGLPTKRILKTCSKEEAEKISELAKEIYLK
jgi:HEPN domain-containing protein